MGLFRQQKKRRRVTSRPPQDMSSDRTPGPQSRADIDSGPSEKPSNARVTEAQVTVSEDAPPTADTARAGPPFRIPTGPETVPRPPQLDFEIAVFCALPLEYDAVSLMLDEMWDGHGSNNLYKTGRIGKHNVVVALLSGMGKASAASTAASIRSSYRRVRLALLVGICGGVPQTGGMEILLGDVVISKAIVRYDFGRQCPDRFECKDGSEDNIARPDKEFRTLLSTFETGDGRQQLQKRTADFLGQLQARAAWKNCGAKYDYPRAAEDKLFEPAYRHKHHVSPTCICRMCETGSDPVCDDAGKSSCDTLRCDEQHLVPRKRLKMKQGIEGEKAQEPAVHIGPVGSGDTVIKSGEHRDQIARAKGIIAFEMEGAGVAEEIPCVVIKGVCDYADCHKNKKWQNFAAATAASVLKAVLERTL
ncbi:nucleoside phosphorylase domain-containing protein [Corynascus similis CBS 632.67]